MGWRQSSHFTGFILHSFSSWLFTTWVSDLAKVHPSYLHSVLGNFSSIFSTALLLTSSSSPWHTGQGFPSALSGSLHLWQSSCPLVQRNTGGSWMVSKHTGHSNVSATMSCKDKFAFRFLPVGAMVLEGWTTSVSIWNRKTNFQAKLLNSEAFLKFQVFPWERKFRNKINWVLKIIRIFTSRVAYWLGDLARLPSSELLYFDFDENPLLLLELIISKLSKGAKVRHIS